MNQQNPTLKKAMLEALEKSLGVVTTACQVVNIDRSTHYDWLKNDPDYKKAVEEISDVALDFAESKLYNKIETGDTTATIFYLKTKGKRRGYIERSEITGADGRPMQTETKHVVEFHDMTNGSNETEVQPALHPGIYN